MGIPTAFVTVAVPLSIAVIFFHLPPRLADPGRPGEGETAPEKDGIS